MTVCRVLAQDAVRIRFPDRYPEELLGEALGPDDLVDRRLGPAHGREHVEEEGCMAAVDLIASDPEAGL